MACAYPRRSNRTYDQYLPVPSPRGANERFGSANRHTGDIARHSNTFRKNNYVETFTDDRDRTTTTDRKLDPACVSVQVREQQNQDAFCCDYKKRECLQTGRIFPPTENRQRGINPLNDDLLYRKRNTAPVHIEMKAPNPMPCYFNPDDSRGVVPPANKHLGNNVNNRCEAKQFTKRPPKVQDLPCMVPPPKKRDGLSIRTKDVRLPMPPPAGPEVHVAGDYTPHKIDCVRQMVH